MQIDAAQIDVYYRTPARIVAAESRDEVLGVLRYALKALFRDMVRFELFLANDAGRMALVSRSGPASARARPSIAKTVRSGSLMSAPLLSGLVPVGVIEVEAASGHPFSSLDLQILEGVAGVLALALKRFPSERSERVKASYEVDRRSAPEVQRRLMGLTLPPNAGVEMDARYLPALEVGGDFFEASYLGDGHIGAAIGDVSGKGVSAALIMSRVSSDVRRAMRTGAGPAQVLDVVQGQCSELEPQTFVTATCVHIDSRRRHLTVANAGHVPIVVRRADGRVYEFGRASGTPLGVVACAYAEESILLAPNDIVLLMTDGLVDALDVDEEGTGSRELMRVVETAPHDPRGVNDHILEAMERSTGAQSRDDVTLVALQLGTG